MRIPTIGLVFHSWMGPKGPYTSKSEHSCTSLLQSKHLYSFSTVIHYVQPTGGAGHIIFAFSTAWDCFW